ncbi:LacI family DNA-binding transcriptional regulator [Bifidobacterium asteroides]|uniref:LacI family DNA-binding transcriptional regulator n=1 Tax=Bifidobacterium asteroides TaxID=1684 RepID=UPI003A813DE6
MGLIRGSKRITLHDVAQKAGVSRSTASRALNGSKRISRQTTQRVEDAARALGFVANAQGRALAIGRSETISILITEPLDELLSDPTYGAFLRGISEELSHTSYLPVLMQASSAFERKRVQTHLEQHTVDAVINISPYEGMELLESIQNQHLPAVLCGQLQNNPYTAVFSNVYSDDVEGAAMAAKAMQKRGRKQIAIILGPADNPAVPDRLEGYRSIYGAGLDESRIVYTGWDESSGYSAISHLLDLDISIDGLLAGSDRIAAGAIAALASRNLSVPDDVSVIGYDDHPIAARIKPRLTTIHQPLLEEGRVAAQLALAMINGEEPSTKILHMRLINRESL